MRGLATICAAMLLALTAGAHAESLGFAGSVTWFGQVPIMVAIDKGFFKEQGLDIEYQVILNSSDRLASVDAGSSAFSNLGRSSVIPAMARGDTNFFYFYNFDDSPGIEGCWARPPVAAIKDLRGKKVAANTSAEITLSGLLNTQDMTEKDVDYLNLGPNEMAPALAKGDIAAACVWQPLLDGLKKAAPDGKLLGTDMDTTTYQKFGTMASPDIVIISRKLVEQHPEQARAIALGILKGADYTIADREDAAKTAAHYFHKTPEEVLEGMKAQRYYGTKDWQEHLKLHTAQMQYLAQWLYDNKKIPSVPDVAKWENSSFMPKP
ncbi:MAG TPA: ABC transporter substrate-binding protein [Acetobacteraceae bacterium]|nr:ABC transporter substrate-binding protein [Acetobacteraceae bacterium]